MPIILLNYADHNVKYYFYNNFVICNDNFANLRKLYSINFFFIILVISLLYYYLFIRFNCALPGMLLFSYFSNISYFINIQRLILLIITLVLYSVIR